MTFLIDGARAAFHLVLGEKSYIAFSSAMYSRKNCGYLGIFPAS